MFRDGLLVGKLLEVMARLKLSQNSCKVIHVERLYHLANLTDEVNLRHPLDLTDCTWNSFVSDIKADEI